MSSSDLCQTGQGVQHGWLLQAPDGQQGVPFDQFVVREPVRAREFELDPVAAPGPSQNGVAMPSRARQSTSRSESNPRAEPAPAAVGSMPQQPGQLQFRESRQSLASSSGVLQRRGASASRSAAGPAWPESQDTMVGSSMAAQNGMAQQEEEDRLAEIRRELPDWRQERDAPLYNTPYKEYRMRRH